jgi:hypothetical protein
LGDDFKRYPAVERDGRFKEINRKVKSIEKQ